MTPAELVDAAEATYGRLGVTVERFAAFLATRELSQARPDLVLACACLDRAPRALAYFEEHLLAPVGARLARVHGSQVADEVVGRLRETLYLAAPGREARLASYAGRGDLRGWLEVVAVREAHKVRRREVRGHDDADILESLPDDDDLELRQMKTQHRAELALAFREALDRATPRSRLLLRQRYLDGLTFDEIAGLHNVHRITVMRWMAHTEKDLLLEIQRALSARLGLATREVADLVEDARSRLDLSLRGLLADGAIR
ncbi:MAG TPA: sigma-70 family RNA polymerase sigma factor [Kofleriaceae bacterium]|jgi:RNA polymerase sigma-70 factor (ECF subfamily)